MTKTRRKAGEPDDVRQRIRECGLRATPGRLATYRTLLSAEAPLSHADLVAALEGRGFDRATIYRNLIDLTEAGLLARSDHGDHNWRFEVNIGASEADHVHFVCVECGDVSCLDGVDVNIRATKGVPRAVDSMEVEVQLRGVCDACS
jgi:Fur family transcriptional regulator, ferric uptake regulator